VVALRPVSVGTNYPVDLGDLELSTLWGYYGTYGTPW
jgi:hypothetical protein